MNRRRDALVAASKLVQAVNGIALAHPPHAVSTVGMMQVSPNSRNTIPGKVFLTIDLRHPDDHTLRSEEHTSELQSLMRISYAVFCLKKKKTEQYTSISTETHTQQASTT